MEITIQSIHFEATQRLEVFIHKKISRLTKFNERISRAEVILKIIKPESNTNKEVFVKMFASGYDFLAQEVSNTFEEAIDNCVEKLERQIVRYKEKRHPKS